MTPLLTAAHLALEALATTTGKPLLGHFTQALQRPLVHLRTVSGSPATLILKEGHFTAGFNIVLMLANLRSKAAFASTAIAWTKSLMGAGVLRTLTTFTFIGTNDGIARHLVGHELLKLLHLSGKLPNLPAKFSNIGIARIARGFAAVTGLGASGHLIRTALAWTKATKEATARTLAVIVRGATRLSLGSVASARVFGISAG